MIYSYYLSMWFPEVISSSMRDFILSVYFSLIKYFKLSFLVPVFQNMMDKEFTI